jgi:serine/threonine protein kinase/Tol biopolymer transport system component
MTPPSTIAHYRIVSKLGEGGMGAVYLATDTKLNREVAIKVLSDVLANNPDYLARFTREAQLLASLNHPNIAIIHGVEDRALVMELVPGATLEERIAAGPIPLDEALGIARQIAEALEAAHEKGVIHRDLKPANVKVTPEGVVKVLDFGLAKAADPATSASAANSPTLTMPATQAGMIMGTAGYMAPEQAAGKPVDKRADIWAFGVVLYEMLMGGRLFEGETVAHTLAAVLRAEIDLGKLPALTPPAIRRLLRRCLDRNLKNRLRDIGEARILLELGPGQREETRGQPGGWARQGVPPWAAAILIVVALALGAFPWRASRPQEGPMMRFSADLGQDAVPGQHLTAAISPDGKRIVFSVRSPTGTQLATRLLDQPRATVLAGTENSGQPFFSPDSQWIGFFADQKMKKISVQGGAAVTLCDAAGNRGGWWADDGNIIATLDLSHLFRVPSAGGKPEMLIKPEIPGGYVRRWPQVLAGGQLVVLTGTSTPGQWEDASIEILSLRTSQVKVVHRGGYYGRYLPSGHLTYVHQGTLFAVPFDLTTLETRGTPVPVIEDLAGVPGGGAGQLDFSQTGTFVYLSGVAGAAAGGSLVWMDSSGKIEPLISGPTTQFSPRVSPDGKRVASAPAGDVVVYDPLRAATTKLTFDGAVNRYPIWTPDGKHIVFSNRAGGEYGILWIRADGSSQPQKLFGAKQALTPTSISLDSKRLAYSQGAGGGTQEIWTLPLDLSDLEHPKPGKPEVFLNQPGGQHDAAFSPDGKWLAYTSFEGGTHVFVRPFPPSPSAGKWLISNAGGRFPIWSRNGREIFYLGQDDRIMVASYAAKGESFTADKPRQWSSTPIYRSGNISSLDLAPDGKRFVVIPSVQEADNKGSVHVTILLNFFDELNRRVPRQ